MNIAALFILCCSSSIGLVFLFIAGTAFLDPLTYTEFFDELQQNLKINPPIIDAKNQLWLHRIGALLMLMISMAACVFSGWVAFVQ